MSLYILPLVTKTCPGLPLVTKTGSVLVKRPTQSLVVLRWILPFFRIFTSRSPLTFSSSAWHWRYGFLTILIHKNSGNACKRTILKGSPPENPNGITSFSSTNFDPCRRPTVGSTRQISYGISVRNFCVPFAHAQFVNQPVNESAFGRIRNTETETEPEPNK